MLRRLLRHLLLAATLATGGASLWALSQNPFAAPLADRTLADTQAVLARHMARIATPARLADEVEQALSDDDMDRLLIALDTATERGIALPLPLIERARIQAEAAEGTARRLGECAVCAWDIGQCKTIPQIAACALPVEITPLGDVNAIRRAAADHATGKSIDRIDLGLAVAGLAATVLVVITGGTSVTLKSGATALRLARRSGRLTPEFTAVLLRDADVVTNIRALPAHVAGRVPLGDVADTARLARLGRIARDLGEVARHTSPAEAIALLRHVDSAEDAAAVHGITGIDHQI